MSERYDCEEARAHYHQVRRGDVTIEELDRYDAHVAECEACKAFVLRLDGMLDAATHVDPIADVSIDRDDMFASIMGAIDAEEAKPAPRLEVAVEEEDLHVPRSPRRYMAIAVLSAAIVVAGLGVALWMQSAPDAPLAPSELAQNNDETTAQPQRPTQTVPTVAITALAQVDAPDKPESVRIHATEAAEVAVSRDETTTRVAIERGTMLVEFLPDREREESLTVQTSDLSVKVVGTVFYVSDDGESSTVGVVTGKVEVTTDDGESLFLTDGQEFDAEFGIRAAPREQRTDAEAYVNIERHKEALAAKVEPKRPAPKTVSKVEEAPPKAPEADAKAAKESMTVLATTLRDQAAEAVRMRQYRDAARLYEELIVELPSGHPAAMSARLDVSRLYMKQLDSPERAVPHLKRFIVDRPSDPAAPSARETLCRILESRGESDAACDAE